MRPTELCAGLRGRWSSRAFGSSPLNPAGPAQAPAPPASPHRRPRPTAGLAPPPASPHRRPRPTAGLAPPPASPHRRPRTAGLAPPPASPPPASPHRRPRPTAGLAPPPASPHRRPRPPPASPTAVTIFRRYVSKSRTQRPVAVDKWTRRPLRERGYLPLLSVLSPLDRKAGAPRPPRRARGSPRAAKDGSPPERGRLRQRRPPPATTAAAGNDELRRRPGVGQLERGR